MNVSPIVMGNSRVLRRCIKPWVVSRVESTEISSQRAPNHKKSFLTSRFTSSGLPKYIEVAEIWKNSVLQSVEVVSSISASIWNNRITRTRASRAIILVFRITFEMKDEVPKYGNLRLDELGWSIYIVPVALITI